MVRPFARPFARSSSRPVTHFVARFVAHFVARFITRLVARIPAHIVLPAPLTLPLTLLLLLLLATTAQAQVSGSAALVSDYRFRGTSLSDERPAVQGNLNADLIRDDHDVWYLGGFVSSVRFEPPAESRAQGSAQGLGYAGYARRFASGVSIDAGASVASFSHRHAYDYAEFHAAIATTAIANTDLTAQISWAPDYFRRGTRALYAELNGTFLRTGRLAPFAHVGVLRLSPSELVYGPRTRIDARAGTAFSLQPVQLQLSWETSNHDVAIYPHARGDGKGLWVARVTCFF